MPFACAKLGRPRTEHKTKCKIREAMGGVLFVDEAYQLATCIVGWLVEPVIWWVELSGLLWIHTGYAAIPGISLKEPLFHGMGNNAIFDGSASWISHPWSKKKWSALFAVLGAAAPAAASSLLFLFFLEHIFYILLSCSFVVLSSMNS